jgi:hypothetical protein
MIQNMNRHHKNKTEFKTSAFKRQHTRKPSDSDGDDSPNYRDDSQNLRLNLASTLRSVNNSMMLSKPSSPKNNSTSDELQNH